MQMSKSTLYKLTSGKRIKFYSPPGAKLLFLEEDLFEYVSGSPRRTQQAIEAKAAATVLMPKAAA